MGWRTGAREGSGPLVSRKRRIDLPKRPDDEDLSEALRGDRVFAFAQVTLLVKIILTVVLFDPRSFDTFTLPKSAASHAASLVLAALLVWLIARYGRAFLFWSPVHVGVGLVLLSFAVATPFALDPNLALFGTFKRYLGLTQMIDNALLYVAVGLLFRGPRSLRLLTMVGVGVAVPVLAYAFLQRLDLDPFRFAQASTHIPISTLGNPDIMGGFISIIGITSLGLSILLRGRIVTPSRAALVLVGVSCVALLYASGVRAGALAIGAGWLATVLLAYRTRQFGRVWAIVVVSATLVLGLLLSPLGQRLAFGALVADPAVSSRLETWAVAARALEEHPVLGLGPDNFSAFYPAHRAESSIATNELQNSPHDFWLYVATSAGSVGLIAMVALVVLLALDGWRAAGRGRLAALALIPLAAYLGQALVNVNEITLDWTFWASAGVIAAGSAAPLRAAGGRARAVRSMDPLGAIALGFVVVVAVVSLPGRIVAGEAMLASEGFANANRGSEALPFAESAVSADPRRPEHWSSLGTALTAAGSRPAALFAYATAANEQPWHPLPWLNLAIVWRNVGSPSASQAAAQRAVASDPYDGIAREFLAQISYERGDYARAASEGVLAIRYQLPLGVRPSAYFTTASAYVQLKDFPSAEPIARELVNRSPTAQFRLFLAAILADRGNRQEAMAIVGQLLLEQPNNADAKVLQDALLAR